MNPLLALLLVVGLLALLPWGLRRLRQRMPALLREGGTASRALRVEDAIPLGNKRMLFSVAVRSADGQQATAVILTGGPADLCIGWLEGGRRPTKTTGGEAEMRKARR